MACNAEENKVSSFHSEQSFSEVSAGACGVKLEAVEAMDPNLDAKTSASSSKRGPEEGMEVVYVKEDPNTYDKDCSPELLSPGDVGKQTSPFPSCLLEKLEAKIDIEDDYEDGHGTTLHCDTTEEKVMLNDYSEKKFMDTLFFDGSEVDETTSDDDLNDPVAVYVSDMDSLGSDCGDYSDPSDEGTDEEKTTSKHASDGTLPLDPLDKAQQITEIMSSISTSVEKESSCVTIIIGNETQ
ncbi:uncharacterized protein LOC108670222 isoform X2 [Hyalella azteca]|uniref:Uncharacterized protein LOC108670222 isoform X2 n=1 Tax=Hyalella azteca TaxID=294128 RepID=A0A979FG34_HYAAZ|nr:uncharacterized protein LOC108670222 isoform X2 [Hyalella azteca]